MQGDRSFLVYIREEERIHLPKQIPNQVHNKEEKEDNDMILQSRSLVLLAVPSQEKRIIKMPKPRKQSPIWTFIIINANSNRVVKSFNCQHRDTKVYLIMKREKPKER